MDDLVQGGHHARPPVDVDRAGDRVVEPGRWHPAGGAGLLGPLGLERRRQLLGALVDHEVAGEWLQRPAQHLRRERVQLRGVHQQRRDRTAAGGGLLGERAAPVCWESRPSAREPAPATCGSTLAARASSVATSTPRSTVSSTAQNPAMVASPREIRPPRTPAFAAAEAIDACCHDSAAPPAPAAAASAGPIPGTNSSNSEPAARPSDAFDSSAVLLDRLVDREAAWVTGGEPEAGVDLLDERLGCQDVEAPGGQVPLGRLDGADNAAQPLDDDHLALLRRGDPEVPPRSSEHADQGEGIGQQLPRQHHPLTLVADVCVEVLGTRQLAPLGLRLAGHREARRETGELAAEGDVELHHVLEVSQRLLRGSLRLAGVQP